LSVAKDNSPGGIFGDVGLVRDNDEGDAFVTSKQTGQTVFLSPGEKVTIKPSGEIGVIELGMVEGCP
jgi:hypothetical protein